jgi:hypothetical protein
MAQGFGPVSRFQALDRFRRQAVCEPESDELNNVLGVEVREVVSRVPALMTHALTLSLQTETRHFSAEITPRAVARPQR